MGNQRPLTDYGRRSVWTRCRGLPDGDSVFGVAGFREKEARRALAAEGTDQGGHHPLVRPGCARRSSNEPSNWLRS